LPWITYPMFVLRRSTLRATCAMPSDVVVMLLL
jgi:hypothetical protein